MTRLMVWWRRCWPVVLAAAAWGLVLYLAARRLWTLSY